MSRKYLVGTIEMTAREMIEFAEEQYGCQTNEALRYTSIAAQELKRHGIKVEEKKMNDNLKRAGLIAKRDAR